MRMKRARPSIKDVAQAAGVATSTVSRVLASDQFGSVTTRDRVLRAVRRLGYDHSSRPRVAPGGAGSLGLVVAQLDNPFFASLATEVLRAARQRNHAVLLTDPEDLAAGGLPAALDLAHQCNGLILWAPAVADDVIEDLSSRTRCVLLNGDHPGIPHIESYGGDGISQAFQHLHTLGHQRFAYVMNTQLSRSLERRLMAARSAAETFDVELQVIETHGNPGESARYAVDLAMAAGITAVIAQNDLMAMSVARRYRELDIVIPDQVSIVGCDDNPASALFTPSLTTLALPAREMAERAVDLVLADVDPDEPARAEVLPAHLVARESTARAPLR